MSYRLSVVNIVPDKYKVAVNTVAAIYGCGENNISVKLQDKDGNIYWGCHSPWQPEDYAVFTDDALRQELLGSQYDEALAALYERLVLDGVAMDNWQAALTELGLSIVEPTE